MKTPKFLGRAMERFLEAPLPDAVFQVAPRALTGIRIDPRERRVVGRFLAALPDGAVRPAFEGTNIADPASLEAKLREGMLKLGLSQGTVAVLIPSSAAGSICSCWTRRRRPIRNGMASSAGASESSCPRSPTTPRIVHQSVAVGSGERIVAAVARPEVVREYRRPVRSLRPGSGQHNPALPEPPRAPARRGRGRPPGERRGRFPEHHRRRRG